jgi:hypothetical protein
VDAFGDPGFDPNGGGVTRGRRGTAEQWIKGGKNAVKWMKLSCCRVTVHGSRVTNVQSGTEG